MGRCVAGKENTYRNAVYGTIVSMSTPQNMDSTSTDPAAGPDSPSPTQQVLANRNVRLLYGATIVSVLGVSAVAPAFPQIVRALEITPQEVGLLITAYTVPGIILTPLLGALADRLGRKRVLVVSLLSFGVFGSACALARDFNVLLGLRVLQGIGSAPVVALVASVIGDLFEGPTRTTAIGFNSAVLNVGTASYPAIGGAVAGIAWYWPFALPALAIPMALLIAVRLDIPEADNGGGRIPWEKLRPFLQQRTIVGLLLANFVIFVLLFGSYLTYLPELIDRRFTSNSLVIGLFVASASLTNGLAATQLERMARFIDREYLVVLSFLISGLSFALIPLVASLGALFAVTVFFGISLGISITGILALLTDYAPPALRATVLSVNATFIRLGQTVGPVLMGGVLALAGIDSVFYAAAVVSAVMFGVTWWLVR